MTHQLACHVIRLTPRGRAAVASVMLVGRDASAILEPCLIFPKSGQIPSSQKPGESNVPQFAYFQLVADAREEIILNFHRPDMIELHCHGGDAVVNAIERQLVERGAVSQTWQDWLLESQEPESFHRGSLNTIQREALQLLPLAETELTVKLLLVQYHGALSRRINRLRDLLDNEISGESLDGVVQEAMDILNSLLVSYKSGRHLTTPFRVGLIGPVNVGKSSLMNALVGFNRSITSQVAGTTRDTVSAKTVIAGWPVMLIDTAGMRETSNPIEQEGISRMQTVMAESDLLLLITDARDYQTGELLQSLDIPPPTPVIHVINKIDLIAEQAISHFRDLPNVVPVSAITGVGLTPLCEAMMSKLHESINLMDDEASLPQTALVFTERQYSQLLAIREMLEQHEFAAVVSLLYYSTP